MKKLITFFALLFFKTIFAQAPQGFNYQATVRNNTGALIVNQNVYFKFNIIQGSSTSLPVFTETHYVPTDELGQVNLVIGQGTASLGTFATIDWSLGNYYLGIELNTGSGYTAMGTTQLLSVPYALYAQNAGNATTPTIPSLASVLAVNNSANNLVITNVANPINNQDAATKSYVDTQITANAQPNGTNIGDLLSWNGSSWQPIANNSAFGGRSTIYITGNITNAQAAQQIAQQAGPNTDIIRIVNTTGLTQVNFNGFSRLAKIIILNNSNLQSVIFNDLTEVYDDRISFENNIALETVSFPNLLKAGDYLFRITNSPQLTTISIPSLIQCNFFQLENTQVSSTTVNNLLNQFLTVLPLSGKRIYLTNQTPSAPPTGQGLIDKQTLIDNGNTVYTD